jgi:hypothetical protein
MLKIEQTPLGPNSFGTKTIGAEPMLLIAVIAIIIVYYFVFASLGNNEDGTASALKLFIEHTLWVFFVVLLLLNGISYIFGIDIIATIKDFIGYRPEQKGGEAVVDDDKVKIRMKEQVFHLPENTYTYEDAKAVCMAYDGRLASYDDLNAAYKKGADWCSYGWSEGQMALFPTQREKWKKLQKTPGHEHDCGRTGINGGYIDDAAQKYGVNCFGSKPNITKEEVNRMINTPIYQKNKKETNFDTKVDYWRGRLNQILVAPFNHNNWSVL